MHLTQANIEYFRSLYNVELPLKPLTILIGPNASGKSNLFKALRFLYDAVAGDRLDWQAYHGQIDVLRWFGGDEDGKRPNVLDFALTFGREKTAPNSVHYAATFRYGDYLEIGHEHLALRLNTSDDGLTTYFERWEKGITYFRDQLGVASDTPVSGVARSSQSLTLREEGPSLSLPQAQAAYSHIAGWRFFDIDLPQARQEAFIPQYPEETPPLAGDASNLSAFLWAISQRRPEDFEAVSEAISNFIELPQRLVVEHDAERGGQSARYRFVERPFGGDRFIPSESISDGTIRLLAYLALLLADHSVTLACLEEPDHGLHPRLMLYLADALRRAIEPQSPNEGKSDQSPQIILTTHSSEFMDCFDLEAESDYLQVYVVERDEMGKTICTPASAQEFAPWLKRYRLGEAVRRRFI
jgi:predicted ATPase